MSEHLGTFFGLAKSLRKSSASCDDMSHIEISPCSIVRKLSRNMSDIDISTTVAESMEPVVWSGWLLKRSRGPLGSWQSRWFELRKHTSHDENNFEAFRSAALIYRSEKGERQLSVDDVRREIHLDSGLRTAFSVCVTEDTAKSPGKAGGGWMQLMAATDLDAVMFLSCLRHILEPERAWPTMQEAIHFPANALRDLGKQRRI
jgi:hypothetical protein